MKHHWTFKIIFPSNSDMSDTSDENVGKLSSFLSKEIRKIINKPHPEINQYTHSDLDEIANDLDFLSDLSKMDYNEREDYDMHEEELFEYFNYSLNKLYNIGDCNKLIYIQTF